MGRVADWQKLLHDYIVQADKPFRWASHDCGTFIGDWVRLATGRDVYPIRGQYKDRRGSIKALMQFGCASIADGWAFCFGKPIPPTAAVAGDIALLLRDDGSETSAIVLPHGVCIAIGPRGIEVYDVADATCAWAV